MSIVSAFATYFSAAVNVRFTGTVIGVTTRLKFTDQALKDNAFRAVPNDGRIVPQVCRICIYVCAIYNIRI